MIDRSRERRSEGALTKEAVDIALDLLTGACHCLEGLLMGKLEAELREELWNEAVSEKLC